MRARGIASGRPSRNMCHGASSITRTGTFEPLLTLLLVSDPGITVFQVILLSWGKIWPDHWSHIQTQWTPLCIPPTLSAPPRIFEPLDTGLCFHPVATHWALLQQYEGCAPGVSNCPSSHSCCKSSGNLEERSSDAHSFLFISGSEFTTGPGSALGRQEYIIVKLWVYNSGN